MTAHRWNSSTDPMAQRGRIEPMDAHNEWLAGMAPRRTFGRLIIETILIGAVAVIVVLLAVALGG